MLIFSAIIVFVLVSPPGSCLPCPHLGWRLGTTGVRSSQTISASSNSLCLSHGTSLTFGTIIIAPLVYNREFRYRSILYYKLRSAYDDHLATLGIILTSFFVSMASLRSAQLASFFGTIVLALVIKFLLLLFS